MLVLAAAVLALLPFDPPAPACSPKVEPQYAFDYSEYVFEGVVVGHVGDPTRGWRGSDALPAPPGVPLGAAGALLVVPDRAVHLPAEADTFAVLPSMLGSLCQPVFRGLDWLRDQYPRGVRLAVTAHATEDVLAGSPVLHSAWDDVLAETSVSFDPWPASGAPPDVGREADSGTPAYAIRARYVFEYLRDLLSLDRAARRDERESVLVKVMGYRSRGSRLFSTEVSPPCVDVTFLDLYLPDPSPSFLRRLKGAGFRQPEAYDGCARYE